MNINTVVKSLVAADKTSLVARW